MMQLPPGCTINYPIRIVINTLTDEIVEWYKTIGGEVFIETLHYNYKGQPAERPVVKYGDGKFSYWMQDGTENVLLHFNEEDANIAIMFIMKFLDDINHHNINESKTYVY